MRKTILRLSLALLVLCAALPARQQSTEPEEDGAYGSRFFDQLRNIFGRFRDSDLERVFHDAQPIQCSELVGRKGEWRPVAFFNEDRTLGDWCRDNLEEVKTDLAVYTFKGACRGEAGTVRVVTEFPTEAAIRAYQRGGIALEDVDVTMNDPVGASLNRRTMAYTFDLPYLFASESGSRKVYSFRAPDRNAAYASDLSSHWECKAVSSKDVTYRFLICRVSTVPRKALTQYEKWEPAFGSSAFFILSDGTEAHTSVHMSFGDSAVPAEKPEDPEPAPEDTARPSLKKRD